MAFTFHFLSMLQLVILALFIASSSSNLSFATDKQSLLAFKSQIVSESTPSPLLNWDQNLSPCNWTGVLCNKNRERVVGLQLSSMELKGSISPHIGNLSFLESLELQDNQFTGLIPDEIGSLSRLRLLNISYNEIQGLLPQNMSMWVELRSLDLTQNKIFGSIPQGIENIKNLRFLSLGKNHISGEIPPSIANISSLVILKLGTNTLSGSIPGDLARLRNLQELDLCINNLTGILPHDIYNMSSLVHFSLASNYLTGNVRYDIGISLPNLLSFLFCFNNFTGTFPGSLHNLTYIQIIRFAHNFLHGTVPPGLGNLPELKMYVIGDNNIVSTGDNGLDFLSSLSNSTRLDYLSIDSNRLEGLVPENIGNLSKILTMMFMSENRIYGSIPSSIGRLSSLGMLSLEGNSISGEVPLEIGQIQGLKNFYIARNNFSGKIPSSLGNCTELNEIDLSRNDFDGTIPLNLGNLSKLILMDLSRNKLIGSIPKEILMLPGLSKYLKLSNNLLTGSLPWEIGCLVSIVAVDVSHNGLSGAIPNSVGECKGLERLIMANNMFSGSIPDSLASVKALQILDISMNRLSGFIPSSLQQLQGLYFLNLSFNNLEGKVPDGGIFANVSKYSLEGNSKLCSSSGCGKNDDHRKQVLFLSVIITVSIVLALSLAISLYCYLRKGIGKVVCLFESSEIHHQFISYTELQLATNNFNEQSLMGRGSFGSVYRGYLREQNLIAVKVLDTDMKGSRKSFLAECIALRNLRHRNLVKLITTCSSIDYKGTVFIALVYELMSNGSLDDWILGKRRHENGHGLQIIERLNVAIDVAYAMDYMHNECEIQVVHCDVKPSNILLDEDMMAKVGDFGLAKLDINSTQSSLSTTNGLNGSIGYIPPEYGMGEKPTPAGDVYSYGITLLEIFTGKKPTDGIFTGGLSIRKWVEMNLASSIEQVLDPNLLLNMESISRTSEGVSLLAQHQHCLVSILEVGLSCTVDSTVERICIKDALSKLKFIRSTYIHSKTMQIGNKILDVD